MAAGMSKGGANKMKNSPMSGPKKMKSESKQMTPKNLNSKSPEIMKKGK